MVSFLGGLFVGEGGLFVVEGRRGKMTKHEIKNPEVGMSRCQVTTLPDQVIS